MKFAQDFIEKVRDAGNIVDEIGQFSQLKPSSRGQHMGLCPYPDHKEKSPSFSVSEDKQLYHCFGCKRSGNIFSFLQDIRGLSFPESIEYLADKSGIAIPKDTYENQVPKEVQDKQKDLKKYSLKVNQFAGEWFYQHLLEQPEGSFVKGYLQQRGLTEEVIKEFRIGYSGEGWQDLVDVFVKRSISLNTSEQLGLVKKRKDKDGYFDIFRDRLMFPIYNHTGDCVGFGGRILQEGQPKYLNSPESNIFHKGKIFYGLFESAKHIRSADQAIVVEGYMDYLALYAKGIKNVVATLGTALTPDHARLIKRYTKNVVVLFDGDEAGQIASERSLPILLAQGLLPKGCLLPEKMDPDDFIKAHGVDGLREQVTNAPELFTLIMNKYFRGYTGAASDKIRIIDTFQPFFAAISDTRLKTLYTQEMADRLMVDVNWLAGEFKPAEKGPRANSAAPVRSPARNKNVNDLNRLAKISVKGAGKAELYLLNLCLAKEDNLKKLLNLEVLEQISHKNIREVFYLLEQFYVQNPSEFGRLTSLLMDKVEPKSVLTMHLEEMFQGLTSEAEEKLFEDCLKKIQEEFLRKQTQELKRNLKGKQPSEQLKELERFVNIQKQRSQLKTKNKEVE